MPEYRANLPRTFTLVVALLMMAAVTGAFAREFRAARTKQETIEQARIGTIGVDRINVALVGTLACKRERDLENLLQQRAQGAGVTIISDLDREPFEEATAPLHDQAKHDPATAELIARIRKVE